MGEATLIRPGVVLQDKEPVQEVIDVLRDALARAERGEIRAVVMAGSGQLEQPFRFSAMKGDLCENGDTLIGQLFRLKQDLSGLVPR